MSTRVKIEPILPKGGLKLFNLSAGQRAKEDALRELGDETQAQFEKTVETWTDKPKFTVKMQKNSVAVSTGSKVYGYVDKGTSAHIITARRKPLLRFGAGGVPKTKVRVISSFKGKQGDIFVSKLSVNHPGTEAREFSVIIQERMQKKFGPRFEKVIKSYIAGEAPGV